jgi:hypothetical protein
MVDATDLKSVGSYPCQFESGRGHQPTLARVQSPLSPQHGLVGGIAQINVVRPFGQSPNQILKTGTFPLEMVQVRGKDLNRNHADGVAVAATHKIYRFC